MKNLPDKIYLNFGEITKEEFEEGDYKEFCKIDEYAVTYCEDKVFDCDVEYVRKDVFIEKALKWYCLDCECSDKCNANYKCFFRQTYKRFLEGNENAIPPKLTDAINPDGSVSENYRYRHFIKRMQDSFIEKACEYLKSNRENVKTEDNGISGWIEDEFIEDFKNYMEE